VKRLISITIGLLIVMLAAAPAVLADDGAERDGSALIAINSATTLPAGHQVDAVVAIRGDAVIEGSARNVTVIDGTATLSGATVDTLVVINGSADVQSGTTISGDIVELNSTVNVAEGATVSGATRSLAEGLMGFALFLGLAALLFWIGLLIAFWITGLAVAAFGARQVRIAEAIISTEPLKTFLVGLAMIFIPILVFVLLAITIIGLPLAFAFLFFVWPLFAMLGYIVAAIWIGDWVLRAANRPPAERPYLAVSVGLLLSGLLGIIPFVSGIISIFGLGSVTIAAWRTFVRHSPPASQQPLPTAAAQ
jgi:hypothetical protein